MAGMTSRACSVKDCTRPRQLGTYCRPHHERVLRDGDPGVTPIRVWSRSVIPVEPLLEYLEAKGLQPKVLHAEHPALYRQIYRATHISEHMADRFACHFAQVHPSAIWENWYELTSEEEKTA